MAHIAISLNEVLRDFISQFEYTYDKYFPSNNFDEEGNRIGLNLKDNPVKSFNLIEHFPFEDGVDSSNVYSSGIDKLNSFLYREAALNIFGHADQLHPNVFAQLNNFIIELNDEEKHTVEIVSREAINSIPSTFFFLSKTLCRVEKIRFVTKHENEWDGVDVLITANPKALQSKPEGKISVKIRASYNENISADYELDNIMEFMLNEDLRAKILDSKIINFEEIN